MATRHQDPSLARPAVRIGTRGSPLALAQSREVRRRLLAAHPGLAGAGVEVVVIRTTGDWLRDRPLAEAGGKGLFTKEIEEALLTGAVDIAVHSMKDMETALPEGLALCCVLPREDPRDVFISSCADSIAALPTGATIGSASIRRCAQVLHVRPDLRIVPIRGNVGTRLDKLAAGAVDALLLALAGLRRLGLAKRATRVLGEDEMLPAVGQGAIGIECREGDTRIAGLLAPLNDAATATCIAAERNMLAALDGSCRTPIAGLARLRDGQLLLRAAILRPDGGERHETTRRGVPEEAVALGRDAGAELRDKAGPAFFSEG